MAQHIDYPAVLNDLERQRQAMNARFDAAIAAIRQIISMAHDRQPALPGVMPTVPQGLPGGPYKDLSMVEAAKAHLRAAGRAVPNLTLAKALEEGGFPHKSKNFPNTLNSVLWRRAKNEGDVQKSAQGWEITPKG